MHEPRPYASPQPYDPVTWPDGARVQLEPRSSALPVNLTELLEQRQTRRDFTRELTAADLGEFLWLACRSRSSRPGPYGTPQESRPHPSAGGMHPIHVLVARDGQPWQRYDPVKHALVEVRGSEAAAAGARASAGELVPLERGVLLALVAEPGKTAAKYSNHESLVWRDAGVVLGYMSLVGEALGLSFCPLGITGDVHVRALNAGERLMGTGLAVLGRA